ncbi:jg20059 [Pararge aegeria aegeria]|uniref:Jg20059 protein n=1 Tax=Pararge aegeria aegeria TaxID=348720 RepID=A0A8S4RAX9_9NEOP|nr:jg20059 [Pararge aegeria aegeria]
MIVKDIIATSIIPEKIKNVMTGVIKSGIFPAIWKTAKLVLLRKPNKKADDPAGYRPLSLLDCYGKLLEAILLGRIEELLQNHCNLADTQFGFRKGKSTLGAIEKVVAMAEAAKQGTQRNKKLCALITLDVKNAFNSAPWQAILEEIKRRGFPQYMYNLIDSYLDQRHVVVRDAKGTTKTFEVSSGVPQGSILGPTLWNILYDEVLRLDLGSEVQLVGFADDLALIVTAQKEYVLMKKANIALGRISDWMKHKRLRLAPEKTEAIMLSGKKRYGPISFLVDGVEVRPGEKLKYLGIWFDRCLKFNKHIEEVSGKAERLTAALGRLMPRRGGPRASKRKLLASVAHSVMLYGAPIWVNTLKMDKYKKMLTRIQRLLAIRICGAYRTISLEAVQVIAGLIPIERLALERTRRYRKDKNTPEEERKRTLIEWEAEWRSRGKGAWTRELIPNLKEWMERKHGEVDRWLTQVLSGHGVFNTYLHTIGKAISDECPYCGENDTPQHAIFECRMFERERNMTLGKGSKLTPKNFIPRMLANKDEWEKVAKLVKLIMKTREDDEWDRQNIEA